MIQTVLLTLFALTLTFCSMNVAPTSQLEDDSANPSPPRGKMAFYYNSSFTKEQLDWATQFEAINTHDFLPEEQVHYLRVRDVKLISYEWTVAFWITPWMAHDAWQRQVHRDHPEWLINSKPLPEVDRAYYYDIANPQMRRHYVNRILASAAEHKYDGVFFDTTDFKYAIPPTGRTFLEHRYNRPFLEVYAEGMLLFMKDLRNSAPPGFIIVTNQGFFQHQTYLPFADYDITESWMTFDEGPKVQVSSPNGVVAMRETGYKSWNDTSNLWKSTRFVIDELINKPVKIFGYTTKFLHLNYGHDATIPSQPFDKRILDEQAIFYGIAAAKIFNHESYFYPKNPTPLPKSGAYHIDLGTPSSKIFTGSNSEVAYRVFTKGLIVINGTRNDLTFDFSGILPNGVLALYDTFENRVIQVGARNKSVVIPPSYYPVGERKEPSARIYLFH